MARPRIVHKPLPFLPKSCIISGRADGDIIDFGAEANGPDPHVYLRRDIVERAAKECGMLTLAEAEVLQAERDALINENAELLGDKKTSKIEARAEAAAFAYAGAAAASAVISQFYPDIELPDTEIIAAAEELVEPTKEEIINART